MKKLPLGIQEFEIIRTEDYLYVDKTKEMYDLLNAGRFLFLARPRRFGKSLLISTIEAFYQGKKELFEGLWIYDKVDWVSYPVIRIDFGDTYHNVTAEAFRQNLCDLLLELGEEFEIPLKGSNYKSLLGELLKKLYKKTGKRVVVLVDEYDKPITDLIENQHRQKENQVILKDFYTVIKGKSKYIQFSFLTGVSKFAKMSVFSGANNFTDISFDERLNALVGIREEELKQYFAAHLQHFLKTANHTESALLQKIKYWYNGYSWTGNKKVYNPHSLLHLFRNFEFKNYWYQSGTTTFLTKIILLQSQLPNFKKQVGDYEQIKEPSMLFDAASIEHININSLLFYTGYLTITEKENIEDLIFYTLNYPNFEVRHSFATLMNCSL